MSDFSANATHLLQRADAVLRGAAPPPHTRDSRAQHRNRLPLDARFDGMSPGWGSDGAGSNAFRHWNDETLRGGENGGDRLQNHAETRAADGVTVGSPRHYDCVPRAWDADPCIASLHQLQRELLRDRADRAEAITASGKKWREEVSVETRAMEHRILRHLRDFEARVEQRFTESDARRRAEERKVDGVSQVAHAHSQALAHETERMRDELSMVQRRVEDGLATCNTLRAEVTQQLQREKDAMSRRLEVELEKHLGILQQQQRCAAEVKAQSENEQQRIVQRVREAVESEWKLRIDTLQATLLEPIDSCRREMKRVSETVVAVEDKVNTCIASCRREVQNGLALFADRIVSLESSLPLLSSRVERFERKSDSVWELTNRLEAGVDIAKGAAEKAAVVSREAAEHAQRLDACLTERDARISQLESSLALATSSERLKAELEAVRRLALRVEGQLDGVKETLDRDARVIQSMHEKVQDATNRAEAMDRLASRLNTDVGALDERLTSATARFQPLEKEQVNFDKTIHSISFGLEQLKKSLEDSVKQHTLMEKEASSTASACAARVSALEQATQHIRAILEKKLDEVMKTANDHMNESMEVTNSTLQKLSTAVATLEKNSGGQLNPEDQFKRWSEEFDVRQRAVEEKLGRLDGLESSMRDFARRQDANMRKAVTVIDQRQEQRRTELSNAQNAAFEAAIAHVRETAEEAKMTAAMAMEHATANAAEQAAALPSSHPTTSNPDPEWEENLWHNIEGLVHSVCGSNMSGILESVDGKLNEKTHEYTQTFETLQSRVASCEKSAKVMLPVQNSQSTQVEAMTTQLRTIDSRIERLERWASETGRNTDERMKRQLEAERARTDERMRSLTEALNKKLHRMAAALEDLQERARKSVGISTEEATLQRAPDSNAEQHARVLETSLNIPTPTTATQEMQMDAQERAQTTPQIPKTTDSGSGAVQEYVVEANSTEHHASEPHATELHPTTGGEEDEEGEQVEEDVIQNAQHSESGSDENEEEEEEEDEEDEEDEDEDEKEENHSMSPTDSAEDSDHDEESQSDGGHVHEEHFEANVPRSGVAGLMPSAGAAASMASGDDSEESSTSQFSAKGGETLTRAFKMDSDAQSMERTRGVVESVSPNRSAYVAGSKSPTDEVHVAGEENGDDDDDEEDDGDHMDHTSGSEPAFPAAAAEKEPPKHDEGVAKYDNWDDDDDDEEEEDEEEADRSVEIDPVQQVSADSTSSNESRSGMAHNSNNNNNNDNSNNTNAAQASPSHQIVSRGVSAAKQTGAPGAKMHSAFDDSSDEEEEDEESDAVIPIQPSDFDDSGDEEF